MTVENNFLRPKTGLDQAVDSLRDPEQLEALAHMDSLSVGLLTGKLVAHERIIETPQFTVTVRGFIRRP